jgi:hypothetical protein
MGNTNSVHSNFKFDKEKSVVERLRMVKNFENTQENKVPIIVQSSKKNFLTLSEEYFKYLINKEYTVEYLINKFKKENEIYRNEIVHFYINNKILASTDTFDNLYYLYKDSDGFLKIIFMEETVEQIHNRDPEIIPVVVKQLNCNDSRINKTHHKYYLDKNLTAGQFMCQIRKDCDIDSDTGLYISINSIYPGWTQSFDELYHLYKDIDGFLKILCYSD